VVSVSVSINTSHLGIGSVVAFLVGWIVFGLFGAVILTVLVMLMLGIIKVR
jgi:hypothetical protein